LLAWYVAFATRVLNAFSMLDAGAHYLLYTKATLSRMQVCSWAQALTPTSSVAPLRMKNITAASNQQQPPQPLTTAAEAQAAVTDAVKALQSRAEILLETCHLFPVCEHTRRPVHRPACLNTARQAPFAASKDKGGHHDTCDVEHH